MNTSKYLATFLIIFSCNIAIAEISFPGGIGKGIPLTCHISLTKIVEGLNADKTSYVFKGVYPYKTYPIDARDCKNIRIIHKVEDEDTDITVNNLIGKKHDHLNHSEKINTQEK